MRFQLQSTTASFLVFVLIAGSGSVNSQSCRFSMHMGEKYDKCSAICQGRNHKCVADDTCLCQSCPNNMGQGYIHTFDEISCEFNQECTRLCMEASTDSDFEGNLGRGKKCSFKDDFYGTASSVCACTCL